MSPFPSHAFSDGIIMSASMARESRGNVFGGSLRSTKYTFERESPRGETTVSVRTLGPTARFVSPTNAPLAYTFASTPFRNALAVGSVQAAIR